MDTNIQLNCPPAPDAQHIKGAIRNSVVRKLRSIDIPDLKLPDEEAVWIRDHPGDLLSPGRPVRKPRGGQSS
jgi:hypothetical protein